MATKREPKDEPKRTLELRAECDPLAGGRQPLPGEQQYKIIVPLEDGKTNLVLTMGQKGYEALTRMMAQMRADDVDDATKALDDALRTRPWTSHSICPLDN